MSQSETDLIEELYGDLDCQPTHVRMLDDGTRIELWRYLYNWRLMRVDDGLCVLDQW